MRQETLSQLYNLFWVLISWTLLSYFRVHSKDESIFSMGGIRDVWKNPETKKLLYSFSLIAATTNRLTIGQYNDGRLAHRVPLMGG